MIHYLFGKIFFSLAAKMSAYDSDPDPAGSVTHRPPGSADPDPEEIFTDPHTGP